MRINARLDQESEGYLKKIKQAKGFVSITDALKYSLRDAASHIEPVGKPGDKFKALLESEFVGGFNGPEDSSVDYKHKLTSGWSDKHGDL